MTVAMEERRLWSWSCAGRGPRGGQSFANVPILLISRHATSGRPSDGQREHSSDPPASASRKGPLSGSERHQLHQRFVGSCARRTEVPGFRMQRPAVMQQAVGVFRRTGASSSLSPCASSARTETHACRAVPFHSEAAVASPHANTPARGGGVEEANSD